MFAQRLLKFAKGEEKLKWRVGEPQENKLDVLVTLGETSDHRSDKRCCRN